jgi:hypothetical protein
MPFDTQTETICLIQAFEYNHPGASCVPPPEKDQSFTYLGVSFDAGGQAILPVGARGCGPVSWSFR